MSEDVKRGRPKTHSTVAKRPQFNARIRPALRMNLEIAAKRNQRSLSEEAEAQLEHAYLIDRFFGDGASADLAITLAQAFVGAGRIAATLSAIDSKASGHYAHPTWSEDPGCYEYALFAALETLFQQHPAPGQHWEKGRELLRRAFTRLAIRHGKTAAETDDLQIQLTPADFLREGELK
jgi:hypothetical protein